MAYPPCSHTVAVTLTEIPFEVGPNAETGAYSPAGLKASEHMKSVFPVQRGNGRKYINLDVLRPILEEEYGISLANYAKAAAKRR